MGQNLVRDRLKTLQLGNIGTELSDASKNAYLNLSEREMKSAIAIGDLIQKTKTFNGATIPNAGQVDVTVLGDSSASTVAPEVGQCFNVSMIRIQNLDPSSAAVVSIGLFDGSDLLNFHQASLAANGTLQWGLTAGTDSSALNLQLTNALYLKFQQDGSSVAVQVGFAYTMDVI
jgi:hypothetical protein